MNAVRKHQLIQCKLYQFTVSERDKTVHVFSSYSIATPHHSKKISSGDHLNVLAMRLSFDLSILRCHSISNNGAILTDLIS